MKAAASAMAVEVATGGGISAEKEESSEQMAAFEKCILLELKLGFEILNLETQF